MYKTQQMFQKLTGLSSQVAVVASLALMVTFSASATPLAPGGSVPALGEPDPVGGTLLFQTNKFFSSASFSGTLISTVYSGDLSNTFGGLTFTYQFNLDALSADAASSLTVGSLAGGFGGYFTDVSYQVPNSTNIFPTSIGRSPTGGGRNVTFDFLGDDVMPGETSVVLVVQTSANGFALGNASLQDDVSTPNILTLIPVTIPEPTSFALFTAGFLVFGVTYFKRRTNLKRTHSET